jgi:hypothetical protein
MMDCDRRATKGIFVERNQRRERLTEMCHGRIQVDQIHAFDCAPDGSQQLAQGEPALAVILARVQ